jgi:hypothetical protein
MESEACSCRSGYGQFRRAAQREKVRRTSTQTGPQLSEKYIVYGKGSGPLTIHLPTQIHIPLGSVNE